MPGVNRRIRLEATGNRPKGAGLPNRRQVDFKEVFFKAPMNRFRGSHGSDWNQGFLVLFFIPGYFFLLFKGGTFSAPLSWPVTLAAHLVLASAGSFIFLRSGTTGFRRAGGFIDMILPALTVYLLLRVIVSPFPRYSMYTFVMFNLHIGVFYSVLQVARSGRGRELILRMVVLGAAGISLFSLIAYFCGHSARASMPLGHHNLLGGYLVITTPLCYGLYRRAGTAGGSGKASAFWLSLTITCAAALLVSGSMGSLLSILLSIVFAVVVFRRSGSPGRADVEIDGPGNLSPKIQNALVVSVLVLLLLWAAPPFRETLNRIPSLVPGTGDSSILFRYQIYRGALDGIRENLFFGSGPGTTPFLFSLFKRQVPNAFSPGQTVAQLHNAYLQIGFELGLVGLLFLFLLQGHFLQRLVRRVREEHRATVDPEMFFQPFFLTSLAGYSLNALTDSQLHVPAVTVTLTVVAALTLRPGQNILKQPPVAIASSSRRAEKSVGVGEDGNRAGSFHSGDFFRPERIRVACILFYGLIFCGSILFLARIHAAGYYYHAALKGIENNEDAAAVIHNLERACAIDRDFGFYHFELGYFLELTAGSLEIAGKHRHAAFLEERALREMEIALEYNPYSSIYLIHAGGLLQRLGQHEKALAKLRLAGILDYFSPFPFFYSGMCLHALDRDAEAVTEFAKAVTRFPRLIFASFWRENGNMLIFNSVLNSLRQCAIDGSAGAYEKDIVRWFYDIYRDFQSRMTASDNGPGIGPAVMYVQKNDLGDRPYSLYVFRKKGLVLNSAPIGIFGIFLNRRILDRPFEVFLEPMVKTEALLSAQPRAAAGMER